MKNIIFVVVALAVVGGGGFYAWQSGFFDSYFLKPQTVEVEKSPVEESPATPIEENPVQIVEESQEEQSAAEKIQEYKEKPTLCERDSDCKIIPITCNKCDCGRAVNIYIEPYACTEADKKNPCNFSCPASKAVCEEGVCKKVNA